MASGDMELDFNPNGNEVSHDGVPQQDQNVQNGNLMHDGNHHNENQQPNEIHDNGNHPMNGNFQNGGFQNGGFQNGGFQNGGFQNGGFNGMPNMMPPNVMPGPMNGASLMPNGFPMNGIPMNGFQMNGMQGVPIMNGMAPMQVPMGNPMVPMVYPPMPMDPAEHARLFAELTNTPEGPRRAEIEERLRRVNGYETDKEPRPLQFNTTSVSFVPLSQQRIDFIRDQLKRQPDLDPRTQANLKEVIRVYSTGELDLARRSKPWELVAFFDGQMKSAGWETIDYEQFWGETVADWKAKNPDAHIWIETGRLDYRAYIYASPHHVRN